MPPPADSTHAAEITHEIVLRAQSGGTAGFRELYERIAPSLLAWARMRAAGSGAIACDPEDVAQEVWARALSEFARFDVHRATFRAWIFGIAKHVLYETWRQGEHRETLPRSPDQTAALESWPDVATSIRTRLARDELVEDLLRRTEAFDPLDRKLLLHCGFEDMSCPQAARQLGIGIEAASKR